MQTQPMYLATDAIGDDGRIDPRYTCDLDNSSPELRWNRVSENIKFFALIAEDPDATSGIFTHWIIYNIPGEIRHLPAGIPSQDSLPNGIRQGVNDFGKLGYSGPCPPSGDSPHRYIFRLFALKEMPRLPVRLRRDEFLKAIAHFIAERAEVVGRYQRTIQRAG